MSALPPPTRPKWDYHKSCFDIVPLKTQHEGDQRTKELVGLDNNPVNGILFLKMWPNGERLSFCFLDASPGTPLQQRKVRQVVREWEQFANIRFYCVDSQHATIRITFDPSRGSWSHVGQRMLGCGRAEPTMNLAWIRDTEDINDTDKGSILHEFGHVLGLGHEHQSPKLKGTVTLKPDAILAYYAVEHPSCSVQWIHDNILDVYNEDISNYTRVDLESVMLYYLPKNMNEQNTTMGPNYNLSDLDKAFITINYPPDDPNGTNLFGWTVEDALGLIGFDEAKEHRILEGYRRHGYVGLRRELEVGFR